MTTTNAAAGAAGRWATGTGEVGQRHRPAPRRPLDPRRAWGMPAAGGRRGSLSSQFDHDPLPDRARRPGPATTKKTFTTKEI